jgi:excisionase family DNA binding protein
MEGMMDLLDIKEAAKELHLSVFTLRSWVIQKRVPHIRLGRRVMFTKADLEKFVSDSRVKTINEMNVDMLKFAERVVMGPTK